MGLHWTRVSESSSVSLGWEHFEGQVEAEASWGHGKKWDSERLPGPYGTSPFPPEASLICHQYLASYHLS